MNPWSIALPAAGITAAVAGVTAWGAVSCTAQLFGPALCRTPRSTEIALTFDDGPNPRVTPQLVTLLERHRVRATFFVVGRFVRAYPGLVSEIAARGHVIGNHTETHPNLALASTLRIEGELTRCQESIADALARAGAASGIPQWLRPPFGYRLPQVWRAARRAGLRGIATWSLTAYDWKPQPPERLIARLASVADRTKRAGDVVLLHDGDYRHIGADRSHVLAALEHWLPRWQDAGFEFVTIEEVAGAPLFPA